MARKQVIDPNDAKTKEDMEKLGRVYATIEDVAHYFKVTRQTVHSTFKKYPALKKIYEEGQAEGRISLRQNLFRMSMTKPPVAIFLAKNLLGMTDKQEISGPDGGAIKIERIENVIVDPVKDNKDSDGESI